MQEMRQGIYETIYWWKNISMHRKHKIRLFLSHHPRRDAPTFVNGDRATPIQIHDPT